MKILYRILNGLLLALLIMAGATSCQQKQEPLEVVAPIIPTDSEALRSYKSSLFSRPIVVGFLNDWRATNGILLANTPDSLDVAIVSAPEYSVTPAMELDLRTVQQEKLTKVLLRADLEQINKRATTELKREGAARRKALQASWTTPENTPSATEQASQLGALEQAVQAEVSTNATEEVKQQLTTALAAVQKSKMDGISVKLPSNLQIFSAEALRTLLAPILEVSGEGKALLLAIEQPLPELRAELEQATWLIFSTDNPEKQLSHFTQEAALWPNNRYLPSVDISASWNAKGYQDSKVFSPGSPLPCSEEVITWHAPNKAGVAYYGIDTDANYSKERGATIRSCVGSPTL